MSDTTQAQLLELAKKHPDNVAVGALLLSLQEGRMIATQGIGAVEAFIGIARRALDGQEGYSISHSQTDMAANATKAAVGLARMAADYCTLACVLQALGEDVCY